MNFERWSTRWLNDIDDPDHQRLLRTYLLWRLHRDLSARAQSGPLSYNSVAGCRNRANADLRWLSWLADHERSVSTVTQADLDAWLTTASNPRGADDFIRWAARHRRSSLPWFDRVSSRKRMPAG